ncbi:MAG: hypothetical protein WDO74_07020 [Pseudomonadota bacterium]
MNQHLRSGCSLASWALCLGLIISVSSCGSSDAPIVGAGAGSAGTPASSAGTAGIAGISGAGAGGSSAASGAPGGGSSNAGSSGSAGSGGQAAPGECTPPTDINAPLEKLSSTGCMSPTDTKKFADRVIPYEVNSPLWSDSADKQRGFVIPAGKTIHIKDCAAMPAECLDSADTGKWVFPVGTVMLKNFLFNSKLVETRLFVRHDEQTWVGYSYQWDAAQTEATVIPDERRRIMFDTGAGMVPWTYPNRVDCMKCHNSAGGFTLGPETRQLNRMVGTSNQIDAIKAKNLFDAPPTAPYQAALVTPFASAPADDAAIDKQARSYMHANCAFCHRPDNLDMGMVNIDLRLDRTLKQTNLCNADPVKSDQGVAGAKLLVPNDPSKSVTWLRVNAVEDMGRMPQIGTYEVHTAGVKLIGDWITSIKTCPQ